MLTDAAVELGNAPRNSRSDLRLLITLMTRSLKTYSAQTYFCVNYASYSLTYDVPRGVGHHK